MRDITLWLSSKNETSWFSTQRIWEGAYYSKEHYQRYGSSSTGLGRCYRQWLLPISASAGRHRWRILGILHQLLALDFDGCHHSTHFTVFQLEVMLAALYPFSARPALSGGQAVDYAAPMGRPGGTSAPLPLRHGHIPSRHSKRLSGGL